ncbi:hypothetical protein BN988_01517 [Oceanobacillus picturae]|uniref:Uncharacterized protein n=1 Tax=Oceanobacillus picturae TaxID=171693 RepID=W9B8Z7_9BACI|nr:hypothetical protein BN988_01517 [Oceanobacillus picturae]
MKPLLIEVSLYHYKDLYLIIIVNFNNLIEDISKQINHRGLNHATGYRII